MQSLLGVHTLARGGQTMPYVREMRAAGLHVPVVLTVNSPQLSLEVKQASPETVTVTRLFYNAMMEITYGMEQAGFDPQAAARRLWDDHFGNARPQPAHWQMDTYWLLMNEHDPPVNPTAPIPYLGYRNQALMCMELNELGRQAGIKMAHMGLNCGTPEFGEWQAMFDTGLFQQMADYGSLLVFHEGVFADDTPLDTQFPWVDWYAGRPAPEAVSAVQVGALCFRYRMLYEGFLKPNGVKPSPAVIGEFYAGGGHGHQWPGRSTDGDAFIHNILGRMRWYTDEASKDDYLLGFCPFTIGVGSGEWDQADYDFLYDPAKYEAGGGRSAALVFAQALAEVPAPRPAPPVVTADIAVQLIAALSSGDPTQVAQLYQPNAAHITGQRTRVGSSDIGEWYAGLLGRDLRGAVFALAACEGEGPSRRIRWTAAGPTGIVADGDDTLGLRDGLIQYHYTYFTIQPH